MRKKVTNQVEIAKAPKEQSGLSRRSLLQSAAALASAAVVPRIPGFSFLGRDAMSAHANFSPIEIPAKNPRWYGFNLLEYFSTDPDWMKYFPYKDDGMFPEDDFRWIRDWGFNWVRLPMDYRFWTAPDLMTIDEKKVEPIDRAIRFGEKYGVHVDICLHRAPGLCILDTMNEKLTGIHITKETTSVFTDPHALDAFIHQWTFFATRYKGISSQVLSFNLVNEPLYIPSSGAAPAEKENAAQPGSDPLNVEVLSRHAADYTRVAKAAFAAIVAVDPNRLVVTDGYPAGTSPIPDLFGTGMLQSAHDYNPAQLTHYHCEWARGFLTGSEPLPTWPLKDAAGKIICDRQTLQTALHPWAALAPQGVPIHFGEMGCYKHTPPDVVLAWFNDSLDIMGELNAGWALWNFRGPFGVLDTGRPGTKFEDWRGHSLDRPLLTLLQKKIKA